MQHSTWPPHPSFPTPPATFPQPRQHSPPAPVFPIILQLSHHLTATRALSSYFSTTTHATNSHRSITSTSTTTSSHLRSTTSSRSPTCHTHLGSSPRSLAATSFFSFTSESIQTSQPPLRRSGPPSRTPTSPPARNRQHKVPPQRDTQQSTANGFRWL